MPGSSEEDETWQTGAGPSEKLAEIGVGRDQDPPLRERSGENVFVWMAEEGAVAHVHGVMADSGEVFCDLSGETLVDQEFHAGLRSGSSRSRRVAAAY